MKDAKTVTLMALLCRYGFDAVQTSLPKSAAAFLVPEIAVCSVGFALAYGIGVWLSSTHKMPVCNSSLDVYKKVAKVNGHRLRYRWLGKLAASFIAGIPTVGGFLSSAQAASTPSIAQMSMFALFMALQALIDEMHDTVSKVEAHAQRVPAVGKIAVHVPFLALVLYLPLANETYAQFAMLFAVTQLLAKKADTLIFQLAIPLAAMALGIRYQTSGILVSEWPLAGMAAVLAGHLIYEVFGHHPVLGLSVDSPVWQLANIHTFTLVCVVAGFLPVQWLCCVTGAYPVVKVGLALGALRSSQEQSGVPSETLGKIAFTRAKDFDQPAVVPETADKRVLDLMHSGRIFRYTTSAEESDAAQAEKMVAEWIGSKYCIGVNSCSSAIYLSLLCAGIKHGDKVLTNAFTFTAVPSSIHNVGGIPLLVECTEGFQMDPKDLEKQIQAHPDCKVLLMSHFRGKLSDCDTIASLAAKHGLILIEDCAHAMGVTYKGKPAGRKGQMAVYSVQSDKVVNAGEGGFVCTDNEEWAAQLVYLSGAYEKRYTGHIAAPVHNKVLMEHAMTHNRNCSFRMSNVVGAMVCAQMEVLASRVELWNSRGDALMEALAPSINAGLIIVPPEVDGAVGCFDHCVFTTPTFDQEQRDALETKCKKLGVALKPFGTCFNARFFKNWNFLQAECKRDDLQRTEDIVRHSWDMKMPLCFTEEDWNHVAAIMNQAAKEVAEMRQQPRM